MRVVTLFMGYNEVRLRRTSFGILSTMSAFGFRLVVRKRKPRRRSSITIHYTTHRKEAVALITQKVQQWNKVCGFSYNRITIRNTKRNWGSCTSLKNLNFNYKILFLPEHLQDYIVVHELCHLQELNHSQAFWDLVATYIPEYRASKNALRAVEKTLKM